MIYGIHGQIGSGKTLLMTACLFLHYIFGRQVYSNYRITFPTKEELIESGSAYYYKKKYGLDINEIELQPPKLLDIMQVVQNMPYSATELHDSTVGIDESYIYADARLSMTDRNRLFSYILLQSRKHKTDILIISQQLRLEDVRIEENTQYEIFCARVPQNMHEPLLAVQIVIQSNYNRKIVYNKLWTNFSPYMDMYDTDEIIWTDTKHEQKEIEKEKALLSLMKELKRI